MRQAVRILGFLLLMNCISQQAKSQAALLVLIFGDNAATENFHFSLDAGLNVSNISNLNGSSHLGGNFGLGVYIKINDKWSFVPEFKPLSKKGERSIEELISIDEDLANELESFESRLVFGYIDIPLMFRYEISPRVYAAAGPQFSFRTSAELKTEAILKDQLTEISITNNLSQQSTWYDMGIAIELGYRIPDLHKGDGVDFKVRWAPGFVNVVDSDLTSEEFKFNTLQFIVSLPFLKQEE